MNKREMEVFLGESITQDDYHRLLKVYNKGVSTNSEAKDLWFAANATVTLHHYNGTDDRPPIEVAKYRTYLDYLNNNPRSCPCKKCIK